MRFLKNIKFNQLIVNKKVFIAICVIAVMAISSVCGIMAYNTDSGRKVNNFTVGRVEIEVSEQYEAPESLTPGTSFTKKPIIKNTGSMECYVRARIDFSDETVKDYVSLDLNSNWIKNNEDGYYYYSKKLPVGDTIGSGSGDKKDDAPFTTVTIGDLPDGTTSLDPFDIYVYVEAVEARDYTNYADAWQYFLEQHPET